MICFVVVLGTGILCFPPKEVSTDSFCSVYLKVVRDKGDGAIKATSGVKRRILANELTYRKLCKVEEK